MKFENVTAYPFPTQHHATTWWEYQIDQNRIPNITKLTLLSDPIFTLSFSLCDHPLKCLSLSCLSRTYQSSQITKS